MMYGLLDKVPCTSLPAQGEQEWENRTLVMSKYLSLADNLDLLREIMQKQYKVKSVQVREKIRSLLKPSKLNKQF
ncbi:hypothetical protein DPMN_008054 [Dreissena polymorpha]|uniref:Uncharacterized protein n=1 Tax=Dreissena polymorpha TaxID=45954 RepID=A0A9D4MZM3_DREPO|nr:hypothetical protein DPMN_008054 [Dreissena polymorpha]